jgi:hypothetical protein
MQTLAEQLPHPINNKGVSRTLKEAWKIVKAENGSKS